MNLFLAAITFAALVVAANVAHARCFPFTGNCGRPGQISCSEANAAYLACSAAQSQRPTGQVGPNNTKEGDPAVTTTRSRKSISAE